MRTPKLCLEAVKKDGITLRYVQEKLRTAQLCLEAIKNSKHAIKYVPEKIRSDVKKLYDSIG